MIRVIRNISVRFWITTLLVLPLAFFLFPKLSGWLSDMPAFIFIALMYVICGFWLTIFMDIAGRWRIKGLVREAQLWERSGIVTRAEKKFIRAVRIYDSAWISLLAARRTGPMLTSAMARFYLASGSRRREIQAAASAWLAKNPKDESLARFWLERIRDQELSKNFSQSILTALADAWYADPGLCPILVGVFLDQGRMDFSARRLYRSFLDMTEEGRPVSARDRARAEAIRQMLSDRLDTPEPDFEPELTASEGGTLGDERADLTTFVPEGHRKDTVLTTLADQAFEDGPAGWRIDREDRPGKKTPVRIPALVAGKSRQAVFNLTRGLDKWWPRVRSLVVICLGVWLSLFAWGTLSHMFKTAEEPARQIRVVIQKPFTIQVAAYHKKDHAERYMTTLAQKGVEASMKVTDGGGKTWYLVQVSQFIDQKSAQAYGNRLKADQIIDEFFVTKAKAKDRR